MFALRPAEVPTAENVFTGTRSLSLTRWRTPDLEVCVWLAAITCGRVAWRLSHGAGSMEPSQASHEDEQPRFRRPPLLPHTQCKTDSSVRTSTDYDDHGCSRTNSGWLVGSLLCWTVLCAIQCVYSIYVCGNGFPGCQPQLTGPPAERHTSVRRTMRLRILCEITVRMLGDVVRVKCEKIPLQHGE